MPITDTIPVPNGINPGVRPARQSTMLGLLGNPRGSYNEQCQAVTNPTLAPLVVMLDLGPFKARGLRPAVQSLAAILSDIRQHEPAIHAALGSMGMLCARLVRGSTTAISNHSWGTAIDLTLDGVLDTRGDGQVQEGLAAIAPFFNARGWFWGAGFGTEDGMHFECGDELIRAWHREGLFGAGQPTSPEVLSLGDRGPDVRVLQQRLNQHGAALVVDADFGPATRAALLAFQAVHGLPPTGIADHATRAALGA
jgi:hypothetical protein